MKADYRKRKISNRFFAGVVALLSGILLIVLRADPFVIPYLLAVVVTVVSCVHLFSAATRQPRRKRDFVEPVTGIAIGILMFCFPILPRFLVPELFALFVLLNAAVKTVDVIIILRLKTDHLLPPLLSGIFFWMFGITLLLAPLYYQSLVFLLTGIYCILIGMTYIGDAARMVTPEKTKNKAKRRLRVSLPIFLAAFIPHSVLVRLNRYVELNEGERKDFEDVIEKKEEAAPDLEIFIQVSDDMFYLMGHCDIYFEGEVITYGNYDESSMSKLGTGDGIIMISHRDAYIKDCIEKTTATLFCFGLRLTEEQKAGVREAIRELKSRLVEWLPPYQAACSRGENPDPNDYRDFPSRVCREIGTKMYKFTHGKFKRYFVLTTNCVLLVDNIIGKAGTDILSINGITSPGTLYEYLEKEFLKPDGLVVSRSLYHNDGIPKDPFGQNASDVPNGVEKSTET